MLSTSLVKQIRHNHAALAVSASLAAKSDFSCNIVLYQLKNYTMIVTTSLHLLEGLRHKESNPAKQTDCSCCDDKKDVTMPEIGAYIGLDEKHLTRTRQFGGVELNETIKLKKLVYKLSSI